MNLEEKLKLSYYKQIANINPEHNICLVQHIETGKIYVKKILNIYNKKIYEQLFYLKLSNLPKIYELYEENDELIIIEEYISGDTLEEIIEREERLPIEEIVNICIKVCDILISLHSLNPSIIHRDIKPATIMRTPDGRVVLIDLNTAKYVDYSKTRDTRLLGTDGYAAPEQYGFGTSDVRTDIYAMGMLIKNLMNYVVAEDASKSKKLLEIIDKCTEINPKDRYESVVELKNKLLIVTGNTNSNYQTINTTENNYRKYLPPGFRSKNPLNMMVAAAAYIFIFWLCITLEVKNSSGISLIIERGFCLAMFLSVIIFSCNYCDIQNRFPICRSRNIYLKILGILVCDVVIVFALAIAMVIIVNIFT